MCAPAALQGHTTPYAIETDGRGATLRGHVRAYVLLDRTDVCVLHVCITHATQGMLLRGTRFGVTPVPRQYALSDPVLGERFQSRYLRSCVAVAPSPFFPAFFTAAYCPSTVALYTVRAPSRERHSERERERE
jgi:hypothetical protein